MISYGQTIRWTDFDGTISRITNSGYDSADEARHEAIERARELGWTPPKWWQFWRWDDTRIKLEG
jgi:hypothetical protein